MLRHRLFQRARVLATPLALVALLALYFGALRPWMLVWGTTPAERVAALPGDALAPAPTNQSTRAIAIDAPAPDVWRWLVQIGEDRAGFYSYSWLENLFGARIRNAAEIRPEWQTLRQGDLVRAVPDGYLGGALETPGWRVDAIEQGRWFVLHGWGVFLVEPTGETTSRVIVRTRFRDGTWWGPVITAFAFDPVHFVMERRMLLGIRARAEGRTTPVVWTALADAGFALAALGTIALGWRRWSGRVALGVAASLFVAVAAGTGDLRAAMAGFVALGLTLLAIPRLRRRWAVLLPVPAVVLVTLLLASDAYLTFGVAFVAIALATAAVRWSRARGRAPAAPARVVAFR
jgi:hypothetical protein